jgi:hypothetical protein
LCNRLLSCWQSTRRRWRLSIGLASAPCLLLFGALPLLLSVLPPLFSALPLLLSVLPPLFSKLPLLLSVLPPLFGVLPLLLSARFRHQFRHRPLLLLARPHPMCPWLMWSRRRGWPTCAVS